MADKKISELNALASADTDDELAIVDVTAPAETKKITYTNLTAGFLTSETDPIWGAQSGALLTSIANNQASGGINTASCVVISGILNPHAADGTIHYVDPGFLTSEDDPIWAAQSGALLTSIANNQASGGINTAHITATSGALITHKADATIHFTSGALWTDINDNTASCATIATLANQNTASNATVTSNYNTHAADTSNPHGVSLTQNYLALASGAITEDQVVSNVAIIHNILFGTASTPPTASNYTQGTIYVQYTA